MSPIHRSVYPHERSNRERPDGRECLRIVRDGRSQPSLFPAGPRLGRDPFGGDDFDGGADALDFGGADEDHFERRVVGFSAEVPSRMELSIWRP